MKRFGNRLLGGLILIFIAGMFVLAQSVKTNNSVKDNWSLLVIPYSGSEWKTMPLNIQSVTTDMSDGGVVEKIVLGNWSEKKVTGLKVKWILTSDKNDRQEGETKLLPANIPSHKARTLEYPIVNFAAASKTLVEGGKLEGSFRIEVVVSEIEYEDGSLWKLGDKGVVWENVNFDEGCANQGCVWFVQEQTYICSGPQPGVYCSVGNQGNSCTVTRCQGMLDE